MSGNEDGGVGSKDVTVTQIGSNVVRIQKPEMKDININNNNNNNNININITLNVQQSDQKHAQISRAIRTVIGNLLPRAKIKSSCRGKRLKRYSRSTSEGKKFHMTLRSHGRGP
ncbi:uncharacterized protein LOC124134413 [Haliotis rufescens]|uniref:uncharacterized protein LOC124134413 n=1 Tax=Haliotis rufescens TaxID=6454 RepID=UPI00201F186D|nr:uncharacterized protein LOC124134413 [Haliotis rufescens]